MINYSNRKAQRDRKPHRNQPGKVTHQPGKKEARHHSQLTSHYFSYFMNTK